MGPASVAPADSTAALMGDRVVRGIVLLCALAAIPLMLPLLPGSGPDVYGQYLINIPFLLAALVSIRVRVRGVDDETERRFWDLLTVGFLCWTGALASNLAFSLGGLGATAEVANSVAYLLFYGMLAAALEVHPHVSSESVSARLRALDRIGVLVFFFGLLLYFLIVPGVAGTDAFRTSSRALFVALDVYLIIRLWGLRRETQDLEWRAIYSCLLFAFGAWGIGDAVWMLSGYGLMPDLGFGTMFDLIWSVGFAAVVFATRARGYYPDALAFVTPMRERFGMGPLVVFAVVPPLLHLALYRFLSPDIALRPTRDGLVVGFVGVLAVLTWVYHWILRAENRRLFEREARTRDKLAHLALHDELTGLPNREMFQDRLQLAIADARRYKRKCAVLFCDLDRFKAINDSLGHEAGDQVLVATARRLKDTVRVLDTVARFGGDEFTIALHGIGGPLDAARLAEKLLAALAEPFEVQGKKHALSASVGIAVFPDDGDDELTLLKRADTAMYQAKLQGRNNYRLFTEAMNDAAEERLAIEQGLREANLDESFVVFYQPILDFSTNEPMGYEALLRWKHPEQGFVDPGSFLDVAEQTGLIVPIGMWVLEAACAWAVEMGGASANPPTIAVNLSARQLADSDLIRDVAEVLERTGLAPQRLQLEITESLAFAIDSTALVLHELRELGVRIAVDDFGTGFAALTRLTELPVDVVKIDRSFVRGIAAESVGETIVRAIVAMARALDFYVVAEGVETEEEFSGLEALQCDAVQGYFIQEPLPPEEIEAAARPVPSVGDRAMGRQD